MRDDIHPLIAGGAVHPSEGNELFAFAENFLDHHIKGLLIASLSVTNQAAQTLEILRGVAQAVDMVEPQPMQSSFRDQCPDQPMRGLERAGVLDAEACERIDIEESAVCDFAGSAPPAAELRGPSRHEIHQV